MSEAGSAAAAGDTGAAAAAAAASAAASAPWYDGQKAEAEYVGTLQTRGLDKKSAPEAAHELYKAHREAQQMISRITGTPDKDRILITPKADAPEAEKAAFYEKLGRPAKAEEYDFADVKHADGTPLDADTVSKLRASAFKANLSKEQAASIAKDQIEQTNKTDEAKSIEAQAKLSAEIRALEASWGPNHDAFLFIAKQAMQKFGFTPEMLQTMQKTLGAGKVMDGFLKLGQATGEGRYIANQAPGGTGMMTAEQAKAKLSELRQDREWGAKLMKGDVTVTEQFNALTQMMVPGSA